MRILRMSFPRSMLSSQRTLRLCSGRVQGSSWRRRIPAFAGMTSFLGMTSLLIVLSSIAFAGSPMYVKGGNYYRWPGGVIKVWFDPGALSESMSNELAKEEIKTAWKKWEDAEITAGSTLTTDIKTASIDFQDMGAESSADIDASNYDHYFCASSDASKCPDVYNKDRHTVIIFDEDGSILADIVDKWGDFTPGYEDGVLGLTDLYAKDDATMAIYNGTIILNGKYYNTFIKDAEAKRIFQAAIVHELGHLLNLDHSAVNEDCYIDKNCSSGNGEGWGFLPTMFRFPVSPTQDTVQYDDKIWSSLLYADINPNLKDEFCHLKGQMFDKEGRGFQGAQILASEFEYTSDNRFFSTTAITGAFYKACAEDGWYYISGLRPGKTYHIKYGSIPNWCKGSGECNLTSGINPYAPPRALGDSPGYVTIDGNIEIKCDEAGQSITADDIVLENTSLQSINLREFDSLGDYVCSVGGGAELKKKVVAPDGSAGTDQKKGWCSLGGAVPFNANFLMFLLPAVVLFFRRYKG